MMTLSNQNVLKVEALCVDGRAGQGWSPILRDVCFSLRSREVLGIVGESGAGKSTAGLATLGFVGGGCRFAGGEVALEGLDMVSATDAMRRKMRGTKVAYVAQSAAAAFNPSHRLIDQHVEVLTSRGILAPTEARRQAIRLYERLGLPSPETIGDRYPHQLSGGQLQRAMIAMALAAKPSVVVFDEPTTALDVTTQIGVLKVIRDVVAEHNTAAIYISHDLAVVAQMADRIIVMHQGKIVEQGVTRAIMMAPEHDYTRTLWAVRDLKKDTASARHNAEPLLEIRSVSARYETVRAVEEVTFDVKRGEVVAIVGESGSGKSTLGRVIAGLKERSHGSITLSGRELPESCRNRSLADLRDIQIVYQSADTALNPRHSVRRILDSPLRLYYGGNRKERDQRAGDLLRLVNLDPTTFLERRPGELSGGQMQRVAIARALAAEPKIIICDEVTSALDKLVAAEIIALLNRLQREKGLSYIFITHDLGVVSAVADRVVVMKNGLVEEIGDCQTILSTPQRPYTRQLLESVPQMDPEWLTRTMEKGKAQRVNAPAFGK